MKQIILQTSALVLFALVAAAQQPYGASQQSYSGLDGPPVQRVTLESLSNLANVEQVLSGVSPNAASSYGNAAAPVSYAPASSVVVPSAPSSSYGSPAASSYGSNAPAVSYNVPAPRYRVAPAVAAQLYPGQNNYRTYQSPPQYSRVALPVLASDAVAKLFVQQQSSYGASAPSSYGASAPSSYGASVPSSYGAAAPSSYGVGAPSSYGVAGPSSYSVSAPSSYNGPSY